PGGNCRRTWLGARPLFVCWRRSDLALRGCRGAQIPGGRFGSEYWEQTKTLSSLLIWHCHLTAVSSPSSRPMPQAKRSCGCGRWISLSAQPLAGTDEAVLPFWSAENRTIGFFADGKLKRVEASGGALQVLADAPTPRGGTWSVEGVILFAPSAADGIYRVPATGGTPVRVTTLDAQRSEGSHRWPCFLPDGHHFIFLVRRGGAVPSLSPAAQQGEGDVGIYAASLDAKDKGKV